MLNRISNKGKLNSNIVAIIVLVIAVAIIFLPVMAGWKGIFHSDHGMGEFPTQYSLASNLQKGVVPLLNPTIWCGAMPFNYDLIVAGGSYYPLWLFYYFADLTNLDNAYWMISIFPLITHYILAAIGMFVLLKHAIKCNYISAVIGAITYIYSPVFVYYQGATNSLIMLSWLPWLLYIYIKTVEKWRLWKVFLGGIIVSFMWIAGRPHFMPFVMIIWGGVVLVQMIRGLNTRQKENFIKPLLIALAIFILGTILSSSFLFFSLDAAQYTQLHRVLSGDVVVKEAWGNLSPYYLATLFIPNLFGSITGNNFIFKPLIFCEANMSGGMATTLLVFLGFLLPFMLSLRNTKNRLYRKYALAGIFLYLFSIFCSLGGNTPFYRLFIGWIPIVGGFPFPIRYRLIQCFAASLLIAIGLNYLTTFKFAIKKYKLNRLVLFYVLFSFWVVIMVLFLPQNWDRENLLPGEPDFGVEEFFHLKEPIGMYTPTIARVKKIKMMFDGESSGEIRYSDNNQIPLDGGILIKNYSTAGEGWAEFDVDIPPNKFLWIYPKSGYGSIGYWNEREWPTFTYRDKWVMHSGINAISFYFECEKGKVSLFHELKNDYVVKTPVITSILYFLLISFLIGGAVYILSPEKFGYFLAIIVLIEFFVFGMMAFYGEKATTHSAFLPVDSRSLRPSDHPMVQRMVTQAPAVVSDSTLRITADSPYYDNFVQLNGSSSKFALMGYSICPFEKRFKHALETAYGQSMDYNIFDKACLSGNTEFLNNFSVGYFLSSNPEIIFPGEEFVLLEGEPNYFAHINPNVLPRAYSMDKIVVAQDQEQLERLVSDDLRKAVYLDYQEGIEIGGEVSKDYISYFKILQKKNLISRINLDNPNKIEVDINVTVPSMLVLTEVWFPGWEATVDGKQTKIYRVNYCQRGIWLDKGDHRVKLEFKPLSWCIGTGISLGTIGLMISLLIINRLRKRKI